MRSQRGGESSGSRHTKDLVNAALPGNTLGRQHIVAGDHTHHNARLLALSDGCRDFGTDGVRNAYRNAQGRKGVSKGMFGGSQCHLEGSRLLQSSPRFGGGGVH